MLVKYGARTEQIPPLRGVKGGVPEVFAVSYTPLAPLITRFKSIGFREQLG